jgi:hypothetical protein
MTDEQPAAEVTCMEPERRQFDFWIGEWEVRDPEGTVVGHNSISPLFGGCALREEWRGRSGLRGTSLNAWSPGRGVWHQTWVDSSGALLLLEGGLRDGAMVMGGATRHPGRAGSVLRHRISWSMVDGNQDMVRQHWETAEEDGAWETAFDGRYRRSPD